MTKMASEIHNILSKAGGKWSIYSKKLATNEVVFELNSDEPFPAASIGKLPIALYVFHQVQEEKNSFKDKITLTRDLVLGGSGILQHLDLGLELTILDVVSLMLMISDNTCAKMLVKKFTPQKINEYIRSLGFKVTGLKIDGDKFGFGMTTAEEISDLLEGLHNSTYFSKELSNQFLNIMEQSDNENRIKRYLPSDRYNEKVKLEIASKGGSIPGVRGDVGIIFEKEPYTLCVLSKNLLDESNKPDNKGILAIAEVSKLIYDYYSKLT